METTPSPTAVAGSRRRLKRWVFLFGAVAAPMLLYGLISVISASILTMPSNHRDATNPLAVGRDAKRWSVKTTDGITLRGWYYPTPERRHLVVLVHGMKASLDEVAGLGRDLHAKGYDVLLFDLRGHGESDPARLTMGRRERLDLRAVLSWAEGSGYDPDRIGWIGFSMGAATLLMEGERNPDIRVAVFDSPFGDLPQLLKSQLPKHSHLPKFFNPGILYAANKVYGVRTSDLKPIRSAMYWGDRPTLIFHGEADQTVPVSQSRALARVLGQSCTTITIPGVGHVKSYSTFPRQYANRVDAFFRSHLKL